jgi:predicted aspartyl protease
LIEAKIDRQPVHLLFDTGSFTTVLTAGAAARLHLREDPDTSQSFRGQPHPPFILKGIGGARFGDKVMADTFELGSVIGRKFHILTADARLGDADGVLSTDFLADYDVDLDFPGNQFRLFRAYGHCDRAKVFLQTPLYATPLLQDDDDPRPRVTAEIDGHHFVALVDTGADRSALYRHAAARLGLDLDNLTTDTSLDVRGFGPGTVAARRHLFTAVTIGDLTLRNTRMDILDDTSHDDIDMILGHDIQHRLHLWISNSAKSLIMQYPPQPSPDP